MNLPAGELRRVLKFSDLLIYGMTYMVPVAPWVIFGFLNDMSGGLPALAYLFGMLCMAFTASAYASMAPQVPKAGSVYAYARVSLGSFAGFLAGWLMLLDYILFPALTCVFGAIGLNSQISSVPREVWVVALVALSLLVNWFGIAVSARISTIFFWGAILVIAVFGVATVMALNDGRGAGHLTTNSLWSAHVNWPAMLSATALGVMSYLGFDGISTLTEEVRPEHRHLVGRAILCSLVVTGILFIVQAVLLADLGVGFKATDLASYAYDLTNSRLGPMIGALMTWTVVVAAIVAMLPICAGVARLLFAMGRDGQLPRLLGEVHPKYGTPHVAMLVTSATALVVALVGVNHADELSSMINFGALGGFCLLHLSVIRYFGVRETGVKFISHRVIPVVGLLISLALLASLSALALEVGFAWLAVGLAYWAVVLRGKRELAVDAT